MWPLIELAVEPKSPADLETLDAVLARMKEEDPSFLTTTDTESGMVILLGSDEAYLAHKLEALTGGLVLNVGAPQVAYRETITRRADIDYRYKRVFGPCGEFARVHLSFEPGLPNSGFVFTSTASPGAVAQEYIAGVAEGLEVARRHGLLAGFPVIDMKAILIDGAYQDVESSHVSFSFAAQAAFRALRDKGGLVLLEPLMVVEVSAPEAYLAAVAADLITRRGKVPDRQACRLAGQVPLASLLGYTRRLDELTDGQGQWTMAFDRYAPISPPSSPDDAFPAVGMRA